MKEPRYLSYILSCVCLRGVGTQSVTACVSSTYQTAGIHISSRTITYAQGDRLFQIGCNQRIQQVHASLTKTWFAEPEEITCRSCCNRIIKVADFIAHELGLHPETPPEIAFDMLLENPESEAQMQVVRLAMELRDWA